MANPYFNATYYLQNNPDLIAAGINTVEGAWAHYVQFGAAEALQGAASRSPAPWFDITYYLNQNADLVTSGLTAGQLFEHFINFGIEEDRQPSADANVNSASLAAYAAANADLREAFGIEEGAELTKDQEIALAKHFYIFGYLEPREGKPSEPASNVGEIINLTSAIGEIVNGTSGDDIIKGVLGATSADSTFQTGDIIDGKLGYDTFELIVDKGTSLPAGAQVSNVEHVVITNGALSLTKVDSSVFEGAEKITLKNNATAVTVDNLSGKELGVQGNATVKVTGDFGSAKVADLELVKAQGSVDLDGTSVQTVNITGSSNVTGTTVQTVTVAGTATAAATALNVNATDSLKLNVAAAGATKTITVEGKGSADLGTVAASVKTLNAAGNTGGVTVTGAAGLQEVTGGSGRDIITLGALLADKGFVKTGAGNDTVNLQNNNVGKGAVIELGAGNDRIVGTGTIDKDAVVDGGDGVDTLALELVGAANIGAFKNFEVFDVAAMKAKTLDLDILASKNAVTEITGSAALNGNVTLTNLGAGVNFVATADMGLANTLTLTQKTAGALTVTLNADSTSTTADNDAQVKVNASNATSLTAVFDNNSAFVQTAAVKNDARIELTGGKATSLEVVSGGTNATNELVFNGKSNGAATPVDLLTSVKITGDQAISFDYVADKATSITTIDASGLTGSLKVSLDDIKSGGVVKLGSGADVVTVNKTITTSVDIVSVEGFARAASKDAADVEVADLLDFTNAATVAATSSAAVTVNKGTAVFEGMGPTTLDDALSLIDSAITVANAAVVFEYLGTSYVFQQGGAAGIADDYIVKLTGVAGVTELAVDTNGDVFLV